MKRFHMMIFAGMVLPLLAMGCGGDNSASSSPNDSRNFTLLISDQPNAIGDFAELWVTISSIGIQRGGESGSWILLDPEVDRIDLTELNGQNAQVIWSGDIESGEYSKLFLYVTEVTGVLADGVDGEEPDIKLPSNKLQISKPFTVSEDASLDFVYDITVIKTGSGMYLVKPQISESGPDEDYQEVVPPSDPDDKLSLTVEGEIVPGAEVTLRVTYDGSPVEGAEVTVNDQYQGTTGADGTISISLPEDEEEIEIKATYEDKEGELEIYIP
jgi:hypothetical protein